MKITLPNVFLWGIQGLFVPIFMFSVVIVVFSFIVYSLIYIV